MTRYDNLELRRLDQESYRRQGYTGKEITINITEMAATVMDIKWQGHAGKEITINMTDGATTVVPILIHGSTKDGLIHIQKL